MLPFSFKKEKKKEFRIKMLNLKVHDNKNETYLKKYI